MLGTGRSGSTLLERALGEVRGVTSLGETVHMWQRGVMRHELCSCGQAFDRCMFWRDVGKHAYGGWESVAPAAIVAARHRVIRSRRIPALLTGSPDADFRHQRNTLVAVLERLYRGVSSATGSDLLVDSSKLPAYGALLRHARLDLRCLFIVRDPRGVAHSWAKSVGRPEIVDQEVLMPQYGAARSASNWTAYAALAGILRATGTPMLTVRYEDFLEAPGSTVSRVLEFASHSLDASTDHIEGRTVRLGPAHTVAGNPMRFATGDIDLVADDAWRSNLSLKDRRIVDCLTVGVRQALGYR